MAWVTRTRVGGTKGVQRERRKQGEGEEGEEGERKGEGEREAEGEQDEEDGGEGGVSGGMEDDRAKICSAGAGASWLRLAARRLHWRSRCWESVAW